LHRPFFWLHTGVIWPKGLYEQILTGFFYLITINGIVGYLLQRIYPLRLTETGVEIVYERIPKEIVTLREQSESLVLACTKSTSSDTLAKHYMDTLDWFFRRPRFFLSHVLGGQKGRYWIRQQFDAVRRYLNDAESDYLDQLIQLARLKNKVDLHYSLQFMMKGWLFIHLPLTLGLIVLAIWHLVLVHVYAL